MSILGNSNNMGTPFFHEFKKQASFFLKEKIKTARLALTDVTPAELLTEEATNENPWAPDTKTMGLISRAAFEVDDYWRIVEILHKRLLKFDRKNWRISYKALIILEHLLTHGPESVAEEFQSNRDVINDMESFQYIDEKGFNWGLTVRKKSERVLKLLEKGPLLKEERNRARKLTRGIEGFGSFCQRSSSGAEGYRESSFGIYGRCNSDYNNHQGEENHDSSLKKGVSTEKGSKGTKQSHELQNSVPEKPTKDPNSWGNSNEGQILEKTKFRESLKENVIPTEELLLGEVHEWETTRESKPLLSFQKDEPKMGYSVEEDHPFNNSEHHTIKSLLHARDEILQGC